MSRLVCYATVQHLPWFANLSTVCWICGIQYVTGTKLRNHREHNHQGVDISTNWGPHRFDVYFWKMESFVLSAATIWGLTSLFDVYHKLSQSDVFTCIKKICVICPGHNMFKAFLSQHGQTSVSEYIISPSPYSMACLLHWCVLLQLLVPLSPEQSLQLLADHGEMPAQAVLRRVFEQVQLVYGKTGWVDPG